MAKKAATKRKATRKKATKKAAASTPRDSSFPDGPKPFGEQVLGMLPGGTDEDQPGPTRDGNGQIVGEDGPEPTKPKDRYIEGEPLDLPVDFGGVSIGDATARVGIRLSRDRLPLEHADRIFCGHRLSGRVVLGHEDESPNQSTLWEDVDTVVSGSFDVKGLSVKSQIITTGLTFSLEDIDVGTLAKFSKGKGRLVVTNVSEIPESDD